MTTEHGKILTLSLTSATLLSVSQATIACSFGILLGSKLKKKNQTPVALALMVAAVATFVPAVGGVVLDLISGPRSKLGVRRRLRSIREGAGLHEEEQLY
jgi:ABC-type Co2+ transport system permease subunit